MGPPSPVTVPTTSWSGRNGLDREPSGASLMRVSRAGSLASRTTNSWWARSSASCPLSRVSRYWRASSFSPFRAALRKPRAVPRGVLRPRGSGGAGSAALVCAAAAAAPGTGWASTPGAEHDESEDSSQQRSRQRLKRHFRVQTTPASGETANHVPPDAALSRSVFGCSSRPPTESRRPPDLPDGNGPRLPGEASPDSLPKKHSGKTLARPRPSAITMATGVQSSQERRDYGDSPAC